MKTIELEAKIPHDVIIEYQYEKRLPRNLNGELPESEQEHIIECLEQGYVEGELNYLMPDGNTENRGWWKIVSKNESL